MPNAFASISFTESVKAAQSRYGSRESNLGFELSDDPRNQITAAEAEFISARDSFYQATISENDWPYVQHRGGPKGFIKILDDRTIGFADLRGNRQYISVGNLNANARISLILMDYQNRRRLKIWGTARIVHEDEDPEMIAKLEVPSYRARVERGIVITVEALEWNCPQHITPRFTEREMEALIQPILEENERLKLKAPQQKPILPTMIGGALELVVSGVRQLTPNVIAYEFRQGEGQVLPRVSAGAHLKLPVLMESGAFETRHYSISSSPNQSGIYEIAVQLEKNGSGGSRFIHNHYQLGTRVHCELAENHFALHTDSRHAVLIAGGIGITPIKAMAHALKESGRDYQLHVTAANFADIPYLHHLQYEFVNHITTYASQVQRLNIDEVIKHSPSEAVFYVCGPERLIKAFQEAAIQYGIEANRVRFEKFKASPVANAHPIEVELRKSHKVINVPSDQSILSAIEAAGVTVPSDCKVGNCGSCAVNVLAGTPEHRDYVLTERERTQMKKMCICVSRAHSSKLVLDL